MDSKRRWRLFVDAAAVLWIGLFLVDLASRQGVLTLSPGAESAVEGSLRALLPVFLLDVALLYRWSEQNPRTFVRSNWIWIVAAIPLFRPLRLLRAARFGRALRIAGGPLRIGSFLKKLRRIGGRLWRRLNE